MKLPCNGYSDYTSILFFNVQEFGRTLKLLWQQMLTNGFWSTWSQLVDSLDPFGEKNALRELGLSKGVSQEEIKAKYRELSKVIFSALPGP